MVNAERYLGYIRVIGEAGQASLSASTVAIVGCGALGSVQAELLGRAGVGRLILIDRDVVELPNLQRQVLYDESDVEARVPKAVAAARRLRAINREVIVEPVVCDVDASNVLEKIAPADIVLDGTDNFETRFVLNDAAVSIGKPWIYGGVIRTTGTVMTVLPGKGPCLRCVCPELPQLLPTCESEGVLASAVMWVAALQVTEAIKVLLGVDGGPSRLYSLDIWDGTARSVEVVRDPSCICCGARRLDFLNRERGSAATILCSRNAVQISPDSPSDVNLAEVGERLRPLGQVSVNPFVLEFTCGANRLVMFRDGRVLVTGTTDTAAARGLVAKYLGV